MTTRPTLTSAQTRRWVLSTTISTREDFAMALDELSVVAWNRGWYDLCDVAKNAVRCACDCARARRAFDFDSDPTPGMDPDVDDTAAPV